MSFFIPEGQVDDFSEGVISLNKVLDIWGEEFVETLKHSLDVENLNSSDLKKSIRYEVVQVGSNLTFSLYFPDYGSYIDEGVKGAGGSRKSTSKWNRSNNKGKMWKQKAPRSRFKFTTKKPPADALESWASKRGLNKFAVQESVFRQGIEPKEWFTRIIQQNPFSELTTTLEVKMAEGVELSLVKVFSEGTENI